MKAIEKGEGIEADKKEVEAKLALRVRPCRMSLPRHPQQFHPRLMFTWLVSRGIMLARLSCPRSLPATSSRKFKPSFFCDSRGIVQPRHPATSHYDHRSTLPHAPRHPPRLRPPFTDLNGNW